MRRSLLASLAALLVTFAAQGRAHAIGVLLPTRPEIEPLAIRHHRVSISVRERIAETRVEQVFLNQSGETLEATYVFPLPPGATVSGFTMWVDGRPQRGELLESAQARAVYEQIVARMRDPGLVEQIGGNLFRARVFPIAPNSEQRIELRFTQTLEYHGGVVHYRYPLRTAGRAARTLEDLTITAEIVSRTPVRAVYSPTHALAIAREGDQRALASYEGHRVALDQDFDLYYAVADGDVGLSLLSHRAGGDDGYFLAMIAPRTALTEHELASKEVIFVFDTSGSMTGDKIARARAALDHMLARLGPNDRFQVVRFSTDVELLFDRGASMPATPANVASARRFASRFVAAGGTAIHGALDEALRTRAPTTATPRMIVFLTDGMPTVGETDPATIVREVTARTTATTGASTRLFVFGVGDDVNTTFLDALAVGSGGTSDYVRGEDGAELQQRLSTLYDRIAYPVLADLHLSLPGASAFDVYPRDLGHLYRGDQLLVVGRYRGEGAVQVVLEGRVGGATPLRLEFPVTMPSAETRNDFLPRVWATRKVATLLDEIRLNGERPELREEVVRLARQFGLVTPYTSYLVAEDVEIPRGIAPVPDARPLRPMDEPAPVSEAQADFERFADATAARAPQTTSSGGGGGGGGGAASMAPEGGRGESGRRLSARLRDLRGAEQAAALAAQDARFVLGRAFVRRDGMWVDSRYRAGRRELRMRWGSEGYFALLRARPELGPALALGDRVTIAIDAARVIVIDPSAPERISETDVSAFLE
ncbi:VIT domain-containing protein [Sandaracinus amylolyticus]|uniref:Inter-alpha-trypsin inhibitor domain protein n=1 Tax=Sandaracinus amylolyticus TaxID=927083 RepID=A0A0F6YJE5_9BACT|nr:VIT domain-containing protein [Sandaracinus amylolyticus]AKF06003.1 Inter-alpha-trypsin inhibitor domain protein [Sandaracinus amylolyticus]